MPKISSTNYVKIDSNKIKALAKEKGISIQKMSVSLGRSHEYLRVVMHRGTMHFQSLYLLCKLYKVKRKDVTPDPKPVITDPPTPSKGESDIDCAVKMSVHGDRVRLTLMVNGQDDLVASAYIKGDGFLDLVKSFSYAAHMCYKLAEQRELNDR